MPRSTQANYEKVVTYFETAPLAEAHVVLSLAKRTLDKREPKARPAPTATTATPAPAKKRGPAKRGPKTIAPDPFLPAEG